LRPHDRDRDAGEARAADEIEDEPAAHAGDLVHADEAGEPARDRHRDHHLVRRADSRVLGGAVFDPTVRRR
jgi:hypothetical protein